MVCLVSLPLDAAGLVEKMGVAEKGEDIEVPASF